MKLPRYILILFASLITIGSLQAQCPYDNALYVDLTPVSPSFTINTTTAWGGDYFTVGVTVGETYVFTTCNGGNTNDTQLTLYDNTGVTVLGYNDDDCGLLSTITWVATYTGVVHLLLDEFNCVSASNATQVDVTCTTCAGAAAGCSYQLDMFDSFGDGWDGSAVDVVINGVTVNSYTVTGASNSVTFNASDCDIVTLSFFDGGGLYNNEVSYNLYEQPDLVTPIYAADYSTTTLIGAVFTTTCGTGCGTGPQNNITCDSMAPACLDVGLNYWVNNSTVTDVVTGQPGNDYDCILFGPDPNWYYLEIATSGSIDMSLTAFADIDFIIWGPFTDLAQAQTACGSLGVQTPPNPANGFVVDCSYSATTNETPSIPIAVAGEVYVMLVTNYANTTQPITLTQTGGTGGTNCAIILDTCVADAGTVTVDMPNTGANNYVLCIGDVINMNSNQDYVLPPAADIAGLGFAIYNCPPTTGNPDTDPCFTGYYWSGDTLSEANVAGGTFYDFVLNNPVPGFATATGNTLCFVPITMDDITFLSDGGADDNFGHDIDGDGCYVEGTPICVTYLDSIRGTGTQSCTTPLAVITLTGGYAGFFNPVGTYTVTNTGPGTMVQSGAQGETLTFTGYTPGQTLTVNVTNDGNGCSQTITYITPACVACLADAGTQTILVNGTPATSPLILCKDDCVSLATDSNFVLPPALAGEDAELMYAIYTGVPNLAIEPDLDPNFSGFFWTGDSFDDCNDPASPVLGAGIGNDIYFVPITMDDGDNNGNPNGIFHYDNDGDSCYAMGTPIQIIYLDSIEGTIVETCTQTTITLTGGFPGYNPVGTYTVVNTGAGTMVQSGTQGETLTFTGYTPGQTISVTVSNDGNSCIGNISHVTTSLPTILLDSITDVSCNGANDGAIAVTILGDTCTYVLDMFDAYGDGWNGGFLDVLVNGVSVGNFSAVLFGSSTTITVPSGQTLELIYTAGTWEDENTYTLSTGGAIVFSDGPTPIVGSVFTTSCSYGYLWSNSDVTPDINGLGPGSYSFTVTTPNGCDIISGPHTVAEPAAVVVTIDSVTNGNCAGGLGAIYTTTTGGTAGYTYNWSNAANTDDIIGLTSNTYTITVTDASGCTATNSAAVSTAPLLAGTATVDSNVTCFGAANGGASVVASGGTPYTVNQPNGTGYTYLWTNGSVNTTSVGLSAGSHCVTITDSLGCTEVVCVNVTEPTVVSASLVTSSNLTCNGDASGSITVSGSGGTVLGNYTYLWDVAAGSQATATAVGLSANIGYTVTVTDDNGCSDVLSNISLTEPSAIIVTIDNTVGTACGDSSGVVMQTSTGGTGTLTYLWSNGAVTEDISGLLASSYTVTVTDASGCTATNSAIVTNTAAGSISFTTTDATCNGASDGCIVATVTGNTGGLGYSWSNGATVDSICGLAAGTYTLTVTDTVSGGGSGGNIVLYDEAFDGTHGWTLNVASGTNGTDPNFWQTDSDEAGVAAGSCGFAGGANKSLHITSVFLPTGGAAYDAGGLCGLLFCPETATRAESPVISTIGQSNITMSFNYIAGGDGLIDNASVVYSIDGGATWLVLDPSIKSTVCGSGQGMWTAFSAALPATCDNIPNLKVGFNWVNNDDGIGTDPSVAIDSVVISTMSSGSGLQVCTIINDTTITEPTAVAITVDSTTNPDCVAANGAAYITVVGGTGAYSFNWSNASTDEDATGLAASTYTVTATDVNGCTDTASATLTAPGGITVTVDSTINVACNPTGAAYITATGGTGTLSYIWSNGAITDDITGLVANTYTVTVSDLNSCSMTASVTITQASGVSVTASVTSNYNGQDVSCFGSTDGEATAVGTGGSPAYTFVWDNGQSTAIATGLGGGTYNVTVTDAGGCSATDVVSVTEPNTLAMSVDTIAFAVCTGSSNGFIDISVSGGTGAIGYSWSNGDVTQDITGLIDSTYTVLVTDANGCTTVDTMVVGTLGFIEIVVDSAHNVGCNGDSTGAIFTTATGDTSIFGCNFNQVALNEIMYRPILSNGQNPNTGEYIELIGPPGANIGCYVLSDGDWTITIPPGTTIPADGFFTIGNDIIWGAGTFDLDAENCGCFTDGASGLGLLILTDGGEYVALYDGAGTFIQGVFYSGSATTIANSPSGQTINTVGTASCVSSVVIPNIPSFETAPAGVANGTSIIRNPDGSGAWGPQVGGSLGSCNTFGTGSTGNGTVTYLWSNGDTTQDVTGLPAGNYTVTATNSYGCTATTSYTITEPTLLTATITNTLDVGCVGDSTGSIDINVTGGTSPYSYNWSNGATTQNVASLPLGNYCVIVTDSNGCVATLCDTISEPFFNIPTDTFYICPGDSVQIQVNTNATVINWTPSATLSNDTIANPFASPTATTTYVVSASVAGAACTMMDSVVVMIETLNVSLAAQTNVNCNGDSTGSITTSIAAGTYNYLWSNGATTANLSGLGGGTYMLTVSNSGTCIDTLIVNITEPAALTVNLSSSSDVICPGDSTGSISVAVTGGTATYSYLWTSGETTVTANALWAGFTVVTVTDANGCTETFDMNVVEPAIIQISSSIIPAGCGGASDGSITVSPVGGNGTPYTYLWDASTLSQTTATATGLGFSTYSVTVTDNAGCMATANGLLVLQAAALDSTDVELIVADTTLACDLTPVQMGINTVNNYTYLWSNGETTQDATGLGLGVYFVTVTNSDGCFLVQTGTISAPEVPFIDPWIENVGQTSATTTPNTLIHIDGNNFQTGVSYLWTETTGLAAFNDENSDTTSVSSSQSGNYVLTLTATSLTSGCQDTGVVVLNVEAEFIGMPNAFTPNGDGSNDKFKPLGLSAHEIIKFRVFNRWGQELYNGDELENDGWDGKYLGVPQPSEAYLFLLEYDTGTRVKMLKGEFILIR